MIVRDRKAFDLCLADLMDREEVGFDLETDGLEVWNDKRLCGVGLAIGAATYYLPFRHKRFDEHMTLLQTMGDEGHNLPLAYLPELWEALGTVKRLVGHNVKFDLAAAYRDGYRMPEEQECEETLCGARIYFPGSQPSIDLESCVAGVLGVDQSGWKQEFKDYLARLNIKNRYDKAEVEKIAPYCESDCSNTLKIRDAFQAFALETGQEDVYKTEQEVVNILWGMESEGIRVDKDFIARAISETEWARAAVKDCMLEYTDEKEFNPWSNPVLTAVFADNGQKPVGYTGTIRKDGSPSESWADEHLQKVEHPLAKLILNWRALDKMLNTYFYPYSGYEGDMVHAAFKSWGAVTGRLSCEKPNLQQLARGVDWEIPQAPGFDIQVRDMFIAPEGYALVCFDYKQMEMVVWADYLNDPELTAKINAGGVDYHDMVTGLVWKLQPGAPNFKKVRQRAKAVSLGLVFGMGPERMAEGIGCTEAEAKSYRDEYFKAFPTAKRFINQVYRRVEQKGYVFNRFGRRYYLDNDFAYKGVNYLVQGTSADIVKRAMCLTKQGFKEAKSKSRLAAQVHDEFLAYIWLDDFKKDVGIVKQAMETQWLKTELRVDISLAAPDWGHKVPLCGKCFDVIEEGECGCK